MIDDPHPHPMRRTEDQEPTARLIGHTTKQLAVQVAGGVMIAAIVGAMSAWGTQQIIGVRLEQLAREVQQLRGEVQDMRRDLYRPRYGSGMYRQAGPSPGAAGLLQGNDRPAPPGSYSAPRAGPAGAPWQG